jgi:ATP-dependent DNA helicase RecG
MVKQVRDVLDKLKLYTGLFIDKSQDMLTGRQNRPRFSDAALQEAFVNALVHRDYEDREPTRITVFSDRIEIVSPGGLMRQIDPERLKAGQAAPHWRNPSLAHFMVRMGFAQQEGQGIPTIIKETVAVSGQPPDFVLEPGRLTVVLPAYQPKREPETPTPPSPSPSPGAAQQDAVILISIGGESVRSAVEPSLAELHLEPGYILVDVASPGYVEPDEAHWRVQAKLIRDALKQWVDAPQYQTFHLFYRGPVVLAPLVAAFIPRDKSLTVYYYHGGKYRVAYTIDRRFRLAKD